MLDSPSGIGNSWLYIETGEWEAREQPHRKWPGSPGQWQTEYESAVPWSLGAIRHSIASQASKGTVPLCSALELPHLECLGAVSDASKDINFLQSIQRRSRRCWSVWRGSHMRTGWGHLVYSAGGDWGQTSLGSSTSSWGIAEGQEPISSLSWPGIGLKKMATAVSREG